MIDREEHPLRILTKRYPQLCLPVEEGVKDSLSYRAVVLRGKEAGALQEIDNKEKDYQGDDARKSDFYFT